MKVQTVSLSPVMRLVLRYSDLRNLKTWDRTPAGTSLSAAAADVPEDRTGQMMMTTFRLFPATGLWCTCSRPAAALSVFRMLTGRITGLGLV